MADYAIEVWVEADSPEEATEALDEFLLTDGGKRPREIIVIGEPKEVGS